MLFVVQFGKLENHYLLFFSFLFFLIEPDLSHFICQPNWQFAFCPRHPTGEVDSFSPLEQELIELSHAGLAVMTERGSAAGDQTWKRWSHLFVTQFGA